MATVSLKTTAAACRGLAPPFSVLGDLYGYIHADADGERFGGQRTTMSLRRQLQLVRGRALAASIFLVGHEHDFTGVVTPAQVQKVQYAIQVTREIYAGADLGIHRIHWRRIGVTAAGAYTIITDKTEAADLTEDFTSPDDGIDVFFVQQVLNAGGWSRVRGSCRKDRRDQMTGAVLELSGSARFTGILLAHEVGHYLGLRHADTITNLMGVDSNGDGIGELSTASKEVTAAQASTMRRHCAVRPPC